MIITRNTLSKACLVQWQRFRKRSTNTWMQNPTKQFVKDREQSDQAIVCRQLRITLLKPNSNKWDCPLRQNFPFTSNDLCEQHRNYRSELLGSVLQHLCDQTWTTASILFAIFAKTSFISPTVLQVRPQKRWPHRPRLSGQIWIYTDPRKNLQGI